MSRCSGTYVLTRTEKKAERAELDRQIKLAYIQGELEKQQKAERRRITNQQAVQKRRTEKALERSRRNSHQPQRHQRHR